MQNWNWVGVFVALIAFATIISLLLIYKNLKAAGKWSLSDALSEEVTVAARDADGKPIFTDGEPILGTDGKPLLDSAGKPTLSKGKPLLNGEGNVATEIVMKASSSRLIALLGLVAILMLYVGAGLSVLYKFTSDGTVPSGTKEISTFFLYGLVMFAPYVVNKFASIFEWLK
jgi:hypothetical protein